MVQVEKDVKDVLEYIRKKGVAIVSCAELHNVDDVSLFFMSLAQNNVEATVKRTTIRGKEGCYVVFRKTQQEIKHEKRNCRYCKFKNNYLVCLVCDEVGISKNV